MTTTRRDHESSLEARLRADARSARVAPPDGLEQRISAAVWRETDATRRTPQREPRRRSFRFFSPTLAGLLTSACAVALVVFWNKRGTEPSVSEADIRSFVDTVQALPARLAAAELPAASTRAVTEPFARELASVRTDARNALDFLAANFLPSDVLQPAGSTSGSLPAQET